VDLIPSPPTTYKVLIMKHIFTVLALLIMPTLLQAQSSFENFYETSRGNWVVMETIDPMTDGRMAAGFLVGEDSPQLRRKSPVLVVRCGPEGLDVFINWDIYLGSTALVTSRVGSESPSRDYWVLDNTDRVTFYPHRPHRLIASLVSTDRWVVQVTPFRENPVTVVFRLEGLEEVLDFIEPGCIGL
jgi:hypothetical protein